MTHQQEGEKKKTNISTYRGLKRAILSFLRKFPGLSNQTENRDRPCCQLKTAQAGSMLPCHRSPFAIHPRTQ